MTEPRLPDRYRLRERLGIGGMGVVWEAWDQERQQLVAIKTIREPSASRVVDFKREFRFLSEIAHPNLVRLYELETYEGVWFLTMERLFGAHFLDHVRPGVAPPRPTTRTTEAGSGRPVARAPQIRTAPLDHARLRSVLPQLAAAIACLHEHGFLHRDIKSSNVLVGADNHTTLCDFGLIARIAESVERFAGTTGYMAPEQRTGAELTAAADWYAFGVVLYEALTGRGPDPSALAPSRLADDVPPELDELCLALLATDPDARPGASDVLRVLAEDRAPAPRRSFAGRDRELAALGEELAAVTATGRGRIVRIVGASGVGKSSLIERFTATYDGIVLEGDCHERETVPYKALDAVVDALARHVAPIDHGGLARLFPAFARGAPLVEHGDPVEAQRRAARVLRDLFDELGQRAPLVITIDDLQWGDRDSALLLAELVQAPAPRFLLVVAHRQELPTAAVHLVAALESAGSACRTLELDPLEHRSIAEELASIEARITTLPPYAWHLLCVIAVLGRPVPERWISDPEALDLLRLHRLVKQAGSRGDQVEPHHDWVRQAVMRRIDAAELAATSREIVSLVSDVAPAEHELLAEHLAATEPERAVAYALSAARTATDALAFDGAARMYALALAHLPAAAPDRARVAQALGEALARAGRGVEAATAYREAAAGFDAVTAAELERRAAEQLLRAGQVEDGVALAGEVLAAFDLPKPRSPRRALAGIVGQRVRLALGGMRVRTIAKPDPTARARVDVCWSMAVGLGLVDTIYGAYFQGRHLALALKTGDPARIVRALAVEIAYRAAPGDRTREAVIALETRTRELALEQRDPFLLGWATGAGALAAYQVGAWELVVGNVARAIELFHERRSAHTAAALDGGIAWEVATLRDFELGALYYLGRLGELAGKTARYLADADRRGDVYASTQMRTWHCNARWLVVDDPARARADIDRAARDWPATSFHLQHFYRLLAEVQLGLYTGDVTRAHELLVAAQAGLAASQLRRIAVVELEAHELAARCALARRDHATAQVHTRAMRRAGLGWGLALADLHDAAIVDGDASRVLLERARERFAARQMVLHEAVARARLAGTTPSWFREQGVTAPDKFLPMISPGWL